VFNSGFDYKTFVPRKVHYVLHSNSDFVYSYLEELGRHNYVTPTSYLELISSFKGLLNKKQDEVSVYYNALPE
jgi:dynein heavy chain